MAIAAVLFSLLLCFNVAVYATDHVVGDSNGWTQNGGYSAWPAKQTFVVGDNLVFNYGSSHNVNEVDKAGYDNCDGSNPILLYGGGHSIIPLTSPGTRYFICSRSNHCSSSGMKLAITVQAGSPGGSSPSGTSPATPSTPSGPASPNTTPSGPASTNTPATTTLNPGGAAGSFGTQNALLVVSSLVLAILFGFMA